MTTCYNPERRIFFVHIPKCAGTSIGGRWEPPNWTGCWLNESIGGFVRDKLPMGHIPVHAIERFVSRPLSWWDKIIVTIRNPFEQQLSQYSFWRSRGRQKMAEGRKRSHPDDMFALAVDFERLVQDPHSNGPNRMCGERWREAGGVYRWWCIDRFNRIPPNVHIIRVEDLPNALYDVLGLDNPPPIPVTNKSDHRDWREAYTPAAYAAVREKFAWSLATYYPHLLTQAPVCV